MTVDQEHWARHARELAGYRNALEGVLATLATVPADRGSLQAALDSEPVVGDLTPAVSAILVDLEELLKVLTRFWSTFGNLPSPPGSNSWTKYLRLPDPYPRLRRGMLDQCFRVFWARRLGLKTALFNQLDSCICGDVSRVPGMEDYQARYNDLLMQGLAEQYPDIIARNGKRYRR